MDERFPKAVSSPELGTKESLTANGWATLSTLEVSIGNCIQARSKELLRRLLEEQHLTGVDKIVFTVGTVSYTYYSPQAQIQLAEQLKAVPKYNKYSAALDRFIADLRA